MAFKIIKFKNYVCKIKGGQYWHKQKKEKKVYAFTRRKEELKFLHIIINTNTSKGKGTSKK